VRLLALWVVLFAVYASALGIEASAGSEYGGDEPRYLEIAAAIVEDGELLRRPQGAGYPVLISPAWAIGGDRAVELFGAAIAALGFVLAALLARRIVPEPYASGGAALAGLSPPAIAHATAAYPELTAGTLLVGAALCAVSARDAPRPPMLGGAASLAAGAREASRMAPVIGGAAMLAALPWLDVKYAVPALPVAVALTVWSVQAGRRMLGIVSAELIVGSVVVYATLNERLYGGPTPYSAGSPETTPFAADSASDYLERTPRLVGLWLDRDYGMLRWAPVLALVFFAAWLLWRSRREHLARLLPERATAEAAAGLALAICGAQLLFAAFAAPAASGDWFPGRELAAALPAAAVLCAWGLRHAPRTGAALGAIGLAASAWLLIEREPWAPPATSAPWGPLEPAFPALAGAALVSLLAYGIRARGSAIARRTRAAPGRLR
jgi:hypothetical protein